jgi:hypothetical protein
MVLGMGIVASSLVIIAVLAMSHQTSFTVLASLIP